MDQSLDKIDESAPLANGPATSKVNANQLFTGANAGLNASVT